MVKELVQPSVPRHHRAILSGALGIFASLLAIAWALFGYNLPAALRLSATQAQNLMLTQVTIAFVTLVAGGLMISRYPRAGGGLLIIGSMATFIIGIFYTRALELAARGENLSRIRLESQFFTATLNIPVDRVVSSLLLFPVFPISILLLVSGLGGLAVYSRQPH